jgi:hypothetical protein
MVTQREAFKFQTYASREIVPYTFSLAEKESPYYYDRSLKQA